MRWIESVKILSLCVYIAGKMIFSDDEEIVATKDDVSSGNIDEFTPEVKVKINKKAKAPLGESTLRVLLELSGQGNLKYRPGLDLVTVLDVSGSMMAHGKLDKLQIAMELVINKLGVIDRLSVITFSDVGVRLCTLRQMTNKSKEEINLLVRNIHPRGSTNMRDGLEMGLKVLSDRKYTFGRSVGIMLMTDGEQNRGGDAARVLLGKVPVFTFCFGSEETSGVAMADVPCAIARNSYGGTFSDVINTDDLITAFAQCLAGLLTLTVQDLELTITPQNSTIERVYAGNYAQCSSAFSLTITLGNLSYKETQVVIVDLVLPAVTSETAIDILQVTSKFSNKDGKEVNSIPITITVLRTSKSTKHENSQVLIETSRLDAAMMMKDARMMADNDNLEDARAELVKAEHMLENLNIDNSVIHVLKYEIQQLLKLMESPEIYHDAGHRFALSSELSHERQRFAGRGDTTKLRLFATPRMDEYREQAKLYPSKPLPTEEDDLKKEQAKKRICPTLGSFITCYIKRVIRGLRTDEKLVYK